MIHQRIAELFDAWAHAEPLDAAVLVIVAIAIVAVLTLAAWTAWMRHVEDYDPDWYRENEMRHW